MRERFLFISMVLLLALSGVTMADVPPYMNYQGILLDADGDPITTTITVVFTIYDASSDGTNLWDESRQVTPDADGRFTIILGEVENLNATVFTGPDRWLGVKVSADPEMTPRARLVTVPFAQRAATVDGGGTSWDLIGNAGTTPGTHFIGTTDNQALELKINNSRAFRLEPDATSPNVVAGYNTNSVTVGAYGATVAGGGMDTEPNQVTDAFGVVGGGRHNLAGDGTGSTTARSYATVAGGHWNSAMGARSTVGGGSANMASGESAAVGGGRRNKARGAYSVVAGGGGEIDVDSNSAFGDLSAIGGGKGNRAGGSCAISGGTDNFADDRSFIGGGEHNTVWSLSVIGGGMDNYASMGAVVGGGAYDTVFGGGSTIGGGLRNMATVDGDTATIAGGAGNIVDATYASVGGGGYNNAGGPAATIPGGLYNQANGICSFSAGNQAVAAHDGSFVWADYRPLDPPFSSTDDNQFIIRATGGVGIGTNSPQSALDVAGTTRTQGFLMPGGTDGYVLTSDAAGNGAWQPAGGGGWSLTGNAGTTPGTNFLGTTDNQALEIKVNNTRAVRVEPHTTSPNYLGGFSGNALTAGVYGATICGGGGSGQVNSITDSYGTVGGGLYNRAGDNAGTIIDKQYTTVGGGMNNVASGSGSAVGGGMNNAASGGSSTVGGGAYNVASGASATVPGGILCTAQGNYTLAAGAGAKANHDGAFVWSDNRGFDFLSTAANQFSARCTGGARFVSGIDGSGNPNAGVQLAAGGTSWSAICDRNLKENYAPVDVQGLLEKVAALPVMTWNAKAQDPSIRHIGPVAQDFYAAFNVGEDNTHITTTDADGVALAAIKALYLQNIEQKQEIGQLKEEIDELRAIVKELLAGKQ